jgi:hypothetical protein
LVCLADPFILFGYGSGFPGYSHFSQMISVLGNSKSPVAELFSIWWVISGIFFLVFAAALYYSYIEYGKMTAVATWLLVIFAAGDCILSGFFPDDYYQGHALTFASKIHVAAGAAGIFALLAFPLVMRKVITKDRSLYFYIFSLLVFFAGMIMALLLFFRYYYVPYLSDFQGLWQRIMMFTFYIYFIVLAGLMLKKVKTPADS